MIVRTVMAAALATVLLIACQDGPGTPDTPDRPGTPDTPGPAWAPPAWVHGTWTGTGATGSLTMDASARNVQVSISTGGGVTVTVDLANLAEEGAATIEYRGGIYSGTTFRGQTGRRYYWLIAEGADWALIIFEATPATADIYVWDAATRRYVGPTPVTRS